MTRSPSSRAPSQISRSKGQSAGCWHAVDPHRVGDASSANDQELDGLLAALATEVRGFMRVTEENLGRDLDEPLPGSTAARLANIYDKLEDHLS